MAGIKFLLRNPIFGVFLKGAVRPPLYEAILGGRQPAFEAGPSHSAVLGVYDPRIGPLEALAVRYGKPHGQVAKQKVRMDEENEKSRIGKPRGQFSDLKAVADSPDCLDILRL